MKVNRTRQTYCKYYKGTVRCENWCGDEFKEDCCFASNYKSRFLRFIL